MIRIIFRLMRMKSAAERTRSRRRRCWVKPVTGTCAASRLATTTGGRVDVVMYRLCAPIFTLSAALILIGAF
jgi:hypothetical protein